MKKIILVLSVVVLTATSCTSLNHSMREPNTRLELSKSDFNLSDQVSASAKTTKILSIDFARLFSKKTGTIEQDRSYSDLSSVSIPVIGNFMKDYTSNYALFELMAKNPNYDVVLYPQYETKISRPFLGLGFILKITDVKATARLGQLKK